MLTQEKFRGIITKLSRNEGERRTLKIEQHEASLEISKRNPWKKFEVSKEALQAGSRETAMPETK